MGLSLHPALAPFRAPFRAPPSLSQLARRLGGTRRTFRKSAGAAADVPSGPRFLAVSGVRLASSRVRAVWGAGPRGRDACRIYVSPASESAVHVHVSGSVGAWRFLLSSLVLPFACALRLRRSYN